MNKGYKPKFINPSNSVNFRKRNESSSHCSKSATLRTRGILWHCGNGMRIIEGSVTTAFVMRTFTIRVIFPLIDMRY